MKHFEQTAHSQRQGKPQSEARPLVLHAVWAPEPAEMLTSHDHHLAIWAEVETTARFPLSRTVAADDADQRDDVSTPPKPHTFCAKYSELEAAFPRLWKTARPNSRPRSQYRTQRLTLWLPTAGTRPYPSPELIDSGWAMNPIEKGYTLDEAPLGRWRVNALIIDTEATGALLASLPSAGEVWLAADEDSEFVTEQTIPARLGSDFRFWAAVGAFAHELIARQRYLPGIRELPQQQIYGYGSFGGYGAPRMASAWLAALGETDVRARFDALADVMPDLCRAAVVEGSAYETPFQPNARRTLESFLNAVISARVAYWARNAAFRLEIPSQRSDQRNSFSYWYGSLGVRWLQGLLTDGHALYASPDEVKTLQVVGNRWHVGASDPASSLFRLCFRLVEPQSEPDSAPPTDAEHNSLSEQAPLEEATGLNGVSALSPGAHISPVWRLEYLLQANDDRTLLAPLETIWQSRDAITQIVGRQLAHPQEYVLTGLARAGRLYEPIERSLAQHWPTGCELTSIEAYQLLTKGLSALEDAGFGVLVPSWWKRRPVKPTLKLRVRGQQSAQGMMGLNAVVAFDWQVALGDQELSREELERLAALKEPLVRLRGQWVELQSAEVETALNYLRKRGGRMSAGEALRASLTGELDLEGGKVSFEETLADGWIADLLGQLRDGKSFEEIAQPVNLRGTLRPYQQRGLSWLNFLTRYGLGACLADDMGMGKTICFLSLALHQKNEGRLTQPVLLVCPTTVVGNWEHEIARFAPDLRTLVHHGTNRLARANTAQFATETAGYDLVITTYSLLSRDEEALQKVAWGAVVLDEAQNVKNADAQQSRAARKLHAPVRVALTGTPVENRLSELWSIMDFLNPGYLGTHKHFQEQFASSIERAHDPAITSQLQSLVRPFVLRRLKTDPTIIQDLPEKEEIKEYCSLTREQVTLYEAVVRDGLRKIEDAETPMQRRGIILGLLTRLKQVCNHPAHYADDDSALKGRSGKLTRLEELIEEMLAEGDRALIFTQYAAFGARLQTHLSKRFGVETLYLHGATPQHERTQMAQHFQAEDGPPLFLLSLKAGGVGLNLTYANQVIHFDRWWNPAVENQATDRAFRIGQTRKVQVRKLICSGTLEEKIDTLIEQKRGLAENVIGEGEGWLTELSTTQLRDLFSLRASVLAD
ncbi:MAG TPA: DEAD/DEAH box helicase [Ktedonobacterales bacterium]|nr:DEAD/DEAH box helicase [Ktedonobacterales bacterium]